VVAGLERGWGSWVVAMARVAGDEGWRMFGFIIFVAQNIVAPSPGIEVLKKSLLQIEDMTD
jgi:hypothetical protein